MSNPLPSFSFGPPAATSSSSSTPSLFGSAPAQTGSTGGFSFGNTASSSTPSGGSLFGATSSTSTGGNIFGATPSAPTGGSLFGATPSAPSAGNISGAITPSAGFSFQKPASTTTNTPSLFGAQQPSTSLFGNPPGGDSSKILFGSATQGTTVSSPGKEEAPKSLFSGFGGFGTPAKSADAGSSQAGATPPAQPSTSLFGPSTTPAGPPPSISGLGASTGTSNLFGGLGGSTATSSQPASSAKSLFSFPSSNPAEAADSTPTSSAPTATPGLFSQAKPDSITQPSQLAQTGFSFGKAATTTSSSTPATTAPPLFAGFSKPSAPSTTTEPQGPKSGFAGSLFNTTSTSAPAASATTTTTTTAPPLFGGLGSTATSNTTGPPAAAAASTANPAASTSAFQPALSTTGPIPGSRLKNKTMDEILNRWATDLNKYTKDFRAHAETVRDWDQRVSENIQDITKLYINTIKSEKEMQAVEWHLQKVEDEQDKLERTLDQYEAEVEQWMTRSGVDQATNELGGPDQEREKTYKLAERLGEKLDDMGKDLGSMIDEINTVTADIGNGKADEPITEIVKTLNSHLSQLQEIDRGTSALQAKVDAAQKTADQLNFTNGFGSGNGDNQGAVNDFYRSYMGRRG